MNGRGNPHSRHWWTAAVFAVSAPLLLTLLGVLWRTPYPISETIALLEDAATMAPSRFLDPAARSWFRPWYNLTWTALLKGTGSLDTALLLFRCLEVGAVIALWLLLIWELRPRSLHDAAAAILAVAVIVGIPGFRDNLEIPLLMTLIGMPLVLIVVRLLERNRRWWHGPVIIALTLIAIGFKEQGLVLVPVVVVAWWMGAPGIGRATAASIVLVTLAYLIFRFSGNEAWPAFVQDVGYGFTTLSPAEATARFGRFPVLMYVYSGTATVANMLFSEPTSGTFTILGHLKNGEMASWEINNVLSSTVLTVLIAWWSIATVRRDVGRTWSRESRLVGMLVIAVAASGALGFSYTRDRLAGMAVVFYALAAFFAMGTTAEAARHMGRAPRIALACSLLLLTGAWTARAVGTVQYAQLTAWKNRREWLTNLQARRTEFANRPDYLRFLNAMVAQGTQPPPARVGSLAQAIWDDGPEEVYAEIHAGASPNSPVAFSHPDVTNDQEVLVSPMVLAVARNSDNAVRTLMSFGARLDSPATRQAICLARRMGHGDIAAIIARDAPIAGNVSCPAAGNAKYPLLDFVERS